MEILCYNSKCKADSINSDEFALFFLKLCYNSSCKTEYLKRYYQGAEFPQGFAPPPKYVLHLPPPRVNSDNVVTSSVNINAKHYRWLLFLNS